MALGVRLAEFLHKFPEKKISLTTFCRIYKKHQIRNKRIKITKLPDRVVRLRIKKQTAFMAKQLHEMIDRGFRIIFLDETLITKSTIPKREWTPKKERLEIDFGQFSREVIAIIASISREAGVDLIMNFGKSVNKEKFKVYLEELRRRYFFDDICIVMDNLRVHNCNDVIDRLDELGIEYIFTPAYSPDFNPIESVFSIFKNQFKRMRISSIVHGREINYEAEIHRIFGLIEKEKVINCIEHA
jgi:transposase